MAKQVEVRDRFRLVAEIESDAFGPLLAQLTRMGLQNITYELITDVISFNSNGPRKMHDTTGDQFAAAWVAEHPTFRANGLVRHFIDSERTSGSAYTALRNMVQEKTIVKVAPGMYKRADVMELEAPKQQTAAKKTRPPNPVAKYDVPNKDLIVNAIKGRKQITSAELCELFTDNGRNPKSVSPIITKLLKAQQFEIISPGVYRILPTKIDKKEKDRLRKQAERDAAKKAKLNGALPSTSEETTHG